MKMELKKWWHNAIGYQIYPKSFQDTNGDGIGDIQGIIQHLDDLKELGVNIIWVSPINESPMVDHGYDISDYYKIDPSFGSNEDLEVLIKEADKRGIKILMDLVINHTSDQHEWFQKAIQNPDSKYADYYIIREGDENGNPPNNWRSIFGGSAWEKIEGTNKYYLHLFTVGQPDLNWENPELREKLYEMVNYWLDKGLGGFRIDAISHIKKDWTYENLPPDGPDGLVTAWKYYRNAEGIEELLHELNESTFKKYDSFTIGEIDAETPEQIEQFIGENGCFSTYFDFFHNKYCIRYEQYAKDPIEMVEEIKKELFARQELIKQSGGLLTNFLENHDKPRAPERFIPKKFINFYSQSLLGTIYFFLRGIPVIYQGQEIGMTDFPKESIDGYIDLATHNNYKDLLEKGMSEEDALRLINIDCRENSRTPMQWNDSENGGFTDGEPWFAVNPNYKTLNYKNQKEDPESLLNYYKKLGALRRQEDLEGAFIYGETIQLYSEIKGCLAYQRRLNDKVVTIIANWTPNVMEIPMDKPINKLLLNNYKTLHVDEESMVFQPFQVIVFQ